MKRRIAFRLGWHISQQMMSQFLQLLGNSLLIVILILVLISFATVEQWLDLPLAFISISMLVILPVLLGILITGCFAALTGIGVALWVWQSDFSADAFLKQQTLRQRAALVNIIGFPVLALIIALAQAMPLIKTGGMLAGAVVIGIGSSVFAKRSATQALEHLRAQGITPRKLKVTPAASFIQHH